MGNLAVQENSPKALKSETINRAVSQASVEHFDRAMKSPQPESRPPHQVEVFIHDSRLVSSGSQFGHASIAVGNKLYSMSHSGLYQTNVNDFIKRQLSFRDTIGFVLDTTPEQAKAVSEKMLEFDGITYDFLTNSCTTTVTSALEAAGIEATDPRFFSWSATPTELLTALQHSPHVMKLNEYQEHDEQ